MGRTGCCPQARPAQARVVTRRAPTEAEWTDLKFAWLVCKHVKSNAIVLARGGMVVGVGAGQMSRVDSTVMAVRKAGERSKGSVFRLTLPRVVGGQFAG